MGHAKNFLGVPIFVQMRRLAKSYKNNVLDRPYKYGMSLLPFRMRDHSSEYARSGTLFY